MNTPVKSGSSKTKISVAGDRLRPRARIQHACVACGQDNPHGLRLRFTSGSDGSISAGWRPVADWEGFEGVVHGGIVSTVLDEAMSKAVAAQHLQAMTCELKVRFRHFVATGEELRIRGWVVEKARRLVKTEATLTAADGSERAHAWASFLALPGTTSPEDASGFARENRK
jgi:acyl-coenzyme A thioesterase PaaI-like protein